MEIAFKPLCSKVNDVEELVSSGMSGPEAKLFWNDSIILVKVCNEASLGNSFHNLTESTEQADRTVTVGEPNQTPPLGWHK